ncbi:hypothetical protein UK23_38905 [Lentzea aerocolonigenes]|uniref:Uncharacterized protein n=1 Tax=Lentzea aerocolonigenes TaxID=68170 RepID=A0A0F0GEV1_LENAE|nr:hypothetical protein [Lentzea aerocolonigenes]KJK42094.1 hypothetical protein UK23_38905 [Lentzea aerocolonigenes]
MSEQEIREGMLLAVWDEPPLDFDPDTLMRRVEQKKSRRRALVAVGVATAMIAVVSLALPGLLPRDRDGQLGSDGQTNSSAPPTEAYEKKLQRTGDAVAEKLALTMPNLKEVYADFRQGGFSYNMPNMSSAPPSGQPRKSNEPQFTGYLFLTDEIGPTSLRLEGAKIELSTKNFCSGAVTCREVPQKDGSVVTEAEFTDGSPDITHSEVVRSFPSGFHVRIASYSYNPASGSGLRQTVPVRVGVLTTLVTDPKVDWE